MKKTIKRKIVRIAAQELRIHPTAQRNIVPSKLKQLIENLDLDAIGVLQAIEGTIDGERGIWIIDGQHRQKALLARGLGEWMVDVCVHLDVDTASRASEVFLKLNDRASMHPMDKFENRVRALDPIAVGVMQCIAERELKLARSTADGVLSCVNALYDLYKVDDGVSLKNTLDTVISAWGRSAAALEGKLLTGIGIVYTVFDGKVEKGTLEKKLAKYSGGASAILGDAKGLRARLKSRTLSRTVADVVIECYNSGKRSGKLDPL